MSECMALLTFQAGRQACQLCLQLAAVCLQLLLAAVQLAGMLHCQAHK